MEKEQYNEVMRRFDKQDKVLQDIVDDLRGNEKREIVGVMPKLKKLAPVIFVLTYWKQIATILSGAWLAVDFTFGVTKGIGFLSTLYNFFIK